MAHNIYALISVNVVLNVVVGEYYECDQVAKLKYGSEAFAINVNYIPVQKNDTYTNGKFYHNGIEVEPIPTEKESIAILTEALSVANSAIDDLTIAILEG